MKVILFFNNQRGLSILNSLVKRNVDVKFVFLSKKNLNTKVYKEVLKQNIPSLKVIKINSEKVKKIIKKIQPDLNIVAGFPYIINKKIYEIPKYGTVNLHAGKLPEYRGGSPLNWQIINGEKKIGISFLKLDKNIDSGNIYKIYYFNLSRNENIKHAHVKANDLFAEKIDDVIQRIVLGDKGRRQNKKSLYWHQRSEVDSQIDWHKKAEEILNFIRALTRPYNGAFTFYQNIKIKIFEAELTSLNFCGTVGRFFRHSDLGLIVVCGENAIIIKEYQISGKISKLSNGLFDYKSTNSKNF